MQYPTDSRRCLTVLDQDSTLIAVIEQPATVAADGTARVDRIVERMQSGGFDAA
jgi:hypothetical protein